MRKVLSPLILIFLVAGIGALTPFGSFARLGVGVGTGKITFDKPLKMGGIYMFPPLTVINTGDEPAGYVVSIEYRQDQPQMSPSKEWFTFTPDTFHLDPGESQVVNIKTSIPLKATPGDYFAFLGSSPVSQSSTPGGATVGISAAAKMYFTIAPANVFQGIYYRLISIIKNNAPWSYVILALIAASILVVLFRKYFTFQIGINKKAKNEEQKIG